MLRRSKLLLAPSLPLFRLLRDDPQAFAYLPPLIVFPMFLISGVCVRSNVDPPHFPSNYEVDVDGIKIDVRSEPLAAVDGHYV